ncbi:MAG: hypothetical protein PWQ55_1347 [Chloroflexota bacterium]|nr:hypothetical protein [Chloroflexota bacterium]
MRLKRKVGMALVLVLALSAALYSGAAAQSTDGQAPVVITFFWSEGCSHCAEEKPFLQELMAQNANIELQAFEVHESQANLDYLFALGDAMGFEATGVPVTVIGEQSWVGYSDQVGAEISAAVAACSTSGCGDPAGQYGLDTNGTVRSLQDLAGSQQSAEASVPVWVWGLGVAALLLVAYGVGAFLRQADQSKKKSARKKH